MKKIIVAIFSMLIVSSCANSSVQNSTSDYDKETYSADYYADEEYSSEAEGKNVRVRELVSVNSGNAAILTDNSLWLWGDNEDGLLGLGNTDTITVPTKLMDDVESIYSADKIHAVLKTDGSLWTWGSNVGGALGKGEVASSSTPQKVMEDVKQVKIAGSSTEAFGMALKEDETLWVWGSNRNIYISDGEQLYRDLPIKLMDNVKDFDMDGYVIKTDNSLWRYTRGYTGGPKKLMDNVETIHSTTNRGDMDGYVIKTDGTLWRVPRESQHFYTHEYRCEEAYQILDNVKEFVKGFGCNYALKNDGSLWEFERVNDNHSFDPPKKLMDNVLQYDMSDGGCYIVLKADETVWTWGKNSYGSLGNGTSTDSETPVQIMDNAKQLYEQHGGAQIVLKNDGTLWGWGWNYWGCLGKSSVSTAYEPIKIMDDVEKVFFGGNACFAEKMDGSLWSWGKNDYGSLGIGTSDDLIYTPTQISFE